MIWDVFNGANSATDPRIPGEYLGSIDIPEHRENGIDINMMRFDLHLRKTNRHAYGGKYNTVKNRFPYTGISFE